MISEAQKQDLRDRNPVSAVAGKWVALRSGGRHGRLVGPCPMHSPNPMAKDSTSFECDAEGWVCAFCQDGGDVFKLVMLRESCSFTEAVALLGGEQEVDPEVAARRQREIAEQKAKQEAEERRKRERDLTRCESIFDRAKEIADTQAAAYLEARGLHVDPSWTFDLRYIRRLPYHGFPDQEASRPEDLGSFPAMVAAIRDARGEMIGLHRTYLDPDRPAKATLTVPSRNKAKKVLGEQMGGLIRLSQVRRMTAIGEGIETSRSWVVMRKRRDPSKEWGCAAGVSLGNLSGRAAATREHPSLRHPSGRSMRVPAEPDFDAPSIVLPDGIKIVAVLGDGDSEPVATRAKLLMGGRRLERQGAQVLYEMAPPGSDFNDLLMLRRRAS